MDRLTRRRLVVAICAVLLASTGCSGVDSDSESSESTRNDRAQSSADLDPDGQTSSNATARMSSAHTNSRDGSTPEWMADRETVAAPWTRVIDKKVARQAVVSQKQIRFPESVASELPRLRKYDIVVSGVPSQSFLRRIEQIREDEGEVILETSSARLNEALLKGQFDNSNAVRTWRTGEDGEQFGPPGDDDETLPTRDDQTGSPGDEDETDPFRTTQQKLRNGDIEYDSLGKFGLDDFDATEHQNVSAPKDAFEEYGAELDVRAEGTPNVSVEPSYWFSMEVDFQSGNESPSSDYFFSTRECNEDSDCFGGAGGGEECIGYDPERFHDLDSSLASKLEEYDPEKGQFTRYCAYTPDEKSTVPVREQGGNTASATEYKQCGELLEVLEWVRSKEGKQCYEDWEPWYNAKGERRARNPESCKRTHRDAIAPFPSQLEWAKLVCDGSLTHAEFDLQNDVDAGVEDFQMNIEGNGSKAWPLVSTGDQVIAGIVFLVGEIPVVVTFNYNVTVPFALNVGAGVQLNPDEPKFVGIRDITVPGGGFHYYASHNAYEKGHFGPPVHERPRDYLESLHFNSVDFDASPEFQAPEVGNGRIEGTATLAVIPEVSLLLYHAAGPYLEPMAPYATVSGSTETEPCSVGAEVGATGAVGLKAQLPFGLESDEIPDTQSHGDTAESADLVEAGKRQILDFLSNKRNKKWMLYDTCGHDEFPLDRFEWSLEGRQNVDVDRMCPEGVDGLCYRKCLYGSCSGDDPGDGTGNGDGDGDGDGDGSPGDGDGDGSGDGSDSDGTQNGTDGGGVTTAPSPTEPEEPEEKGPIAKSFGCSSGGQGGPPPAWLLVAGLGAALVRRR